MECIAVIAVSAALIFARLAVMQELNPILWGTLALVIYAGAPTVMIYRGAGLMAAPWIWISSFLGLFVLFVVQCVVAERQRYRNRGGAVGKAKKAGRNMRRD
jgi:hypothetical protein